MSRVGDAFYITRDLIDGWLDGKANLGSLVAGRFNEMIKLGNVEDIKLEWNKVRDRLEVAIYYGPYTERNDATDAFTRQMGGLNE